MSTLCTEVIRLETAKALVRGRGTGVRVALLDSGVESWHPDLNDLSLCSDFIFERESSDVVIRAGRGEDAFGHGTALAGLLKGLAPDVQIGSFRVLGSTLTGRTELIAAAVRKAIDGGYQILHCSFGCRGEDRFLPAYKRWIDTAYLAGVHVVAASNNDNVQQPEWPAHFATVCAVTAGEFLPGELLSGGPVIRSRRGSLVEFEAPGHNITVPWREGTTRKVSGSSYAAVHVSAALARIVGELGPNVPPLLAKQMLLSDC